MECPNCSFQNMPGLKRCGRCASVLDLSDAEWRPPRSRHSTGARAVATIVRRDLFATRADLARSGARLGAALAEVRATPAIWTAVALSIIPGLGHAWLGQRWLGLAITGAWVAILVGMLLQFGTGVAWVFYFLAVGLHTAALSLLFAAAIPDVSLIRRAVIGVAIWAALQIALYVPGGWLATRYATLTRIEGMMPNPTIANGDLVVTAGAWLGNGRFERGDLVLYDVNPISGHGYELQAGQAIDRIIAVEGDFVAVKDGVLTVNGKPLAEADGPISRLVFVPEDFRTLVERDCVLILPSTIRLPNQRGDHAWQAAFRRLLAGAAVVRTERIVGKVTWRIRPWGRIETIPTTSSAARRPSPQETPTP